MYLVFRKLELENKDGFAAGLCSLEMNWKIARPLILPCQHARWHLGQSRPARLGGDRTWDFYRAERELPESRKDTHGGDEGTEDIRLALVVWAQENRELVQTHTGSLGYAPILLD